MRPVNTFYNFERKIMQIYHFSSPNYAQSTHKKEDPFTALTALSFEIKNLFTNFVEKQSNTQNND